jgi:adenine deaminase
LTGPFLQASVALGAQSDHETGTAEEALEKVQAGVIVQMREGSGARDLSNLLGAITERGADPRCFAFSTDEQELSSLVTDGHIDHKLRRAVAAGVPPVEAVRMATLNAAASLGVQRDYGAVAPGRVASLAVVEDLASFRVTTCVARGAVVGETAAPRPYPAAWRDTVRVERTFEAEDFALDVADGTASVRVIGVTEGSLLTSELVETLDVDGGRLDSRPSGLAKIAVFDRHEGGSRGAAGLIRGTGVEAGAFATTVNPGMMNLVAVGADDDDMAVAANRVVELGGGIVVVRDGEVRAEIALPLFGILSDSPADDVAAACVAVERALCDELGSRVRGVLTTVGFACLAVSIPALKICDRGLVRVARDGQEAVELLAGDVKSKERER